MNKRPVGKKAEPTEEELEFIYSRMEKLSDQEVLEEMSDTEFPLRSLGFIKRRRREYRAAKRVLESSALRQTDPILFDAQKKHIEEIQELFERWYEIMKNQDAFLIAEIENMEQYINKWWALPKEMPNIKWDPLFECLKGHLNNTFWSAYDAWENLYKQYYNGCVSLIEQFKNSVESQLKAKNEKDVAYPMLEITTMKTLGNKTVQDYETSEPGYWDFDYYSRGNYLMAKLENGKKEFTILEANSPEEIVNEYLELCNKYATSKDAAKLIEMYNELYEACDKVKQEMSDAVIRKDYVMNICHLCPGAQTSFNNLD